MASTSGVGSVIGALAVLHGVDTMMAGMGQLITGEETRTITAHVIGQLTGSQEIGDFADMAIGAGLTMGSGAIASSARMATIAGRGVSLTTRLETNAASRLARLEATSPKAHFFSRHGAATTIEQQYVRATTGLTPDGVMLRPVDSSRFLTHRAQLAAVERAQARFALTGERSFSFEMSEIIGEGFIRGGGSWVQTTNVHAVFKNGRLHTLYPFLSPLP